MYAALKLNVLDLLSFRSRLSIGAAPCRINIVAARSDGGRAGDEDCARRTPCAERGNSDGADDSGGAGSGYWGPGVDGGRSLVTLTSSSHSEGERIRRTHTNRLRLAREWQLQSPRVKHHPWDAPIPCIRDVPNNRMAERVHVYTKLMPPATLRNHKQLCHFAPTTR